MMGRQTSGQEKLFCVFGVETVVSNDHLLRGIDGGLGLSGLRTHLATNLLLSTNRPKICVNSFDGCPACKL